MKDEHQKLVPEWSFDVLKHKNEEERKVYYLIAKKFRLSFYFDFASIRQ